MSNFFDSAFLTRCENSVKVFTVFFVSFPPKGMTYARADFKSELKLKNIEKEKVILEKELKKIKEKLKKMLE